MILMQFEWGGKCRKCGEQVEPLTLGWFLPTAPRGQRILCITCGDTAVSEPYDMDKHDIDAEWEAMGDSVG